MCWFWLQRLERRHGSVEDAMGKETRMGSELSWSWWLRAEPPWLKGGKHMKAGWGKWSIFAWAVPKGLCGELLLWEVDLCWEKTFQNSRHISHNGWGEVLLKGCFGDRNLISLTQSLTKSSTDELRALKHQCHFEQRPNQNLDLNTLFGSSLWNQIISVVYSRVCFFACPGILSCLLAICLLISALLMPIGRDFPSHSRADSQHTFEVLREIVALGIFHAVTYLCWVFFSQFLIVTWIHNNHLHNVINKGFWTMLMGI